MRVGLLGGSFNPPHQGHLHLSNLAIKKLRLNQIWWIPTLKNPLKEAVIFEPYLSRVQKCEELIRNHPKLRLKQFDEIYTEKMVDRLQKRFPQIEFFWVMGADNLENFHKWKNFKKLIELIPIAIFSRENFLQKARKTKVFHVKLQQKFQVFHTKNMDISSTQIRQKSK